MVLIDPDLLDSAAADLASVSARLESLRASSVSSLFQVYRSEPAAVVDRRMWAATSVIDRVQADLATRAALGHRLEATTFDVPVTGQSAARYRSRAERVHGDGGGAELRTRWRHIAALWHRLDAHEHEPRNATSAASAAEARRHLSEVTAGLDRSDWAAIAHWEAGIEPRAWRPELGLAANESTIAAVYDFYARLYLGSPEFEWAGMANLVGPMFYAGWQDLSGLRYLLDPSQRVHALGLTSGVRWLNLPPAVTIGVASLAGRELAWLETQLLDMQKQIFEDLAWMHVAFRYGGLDAVTANVHDPGLIDAWTDIASGESERVRAGNVALLRREQSEIIQDDYDRIARHNGIVGGILADALTWLADAPFPGSRPYRVAVAEGIEVIDIDGRDADWWPPAEWLPLEVSTTVVSVPRGHVTCFEDRWQWITDDLLPAYHDLADDPDRLRVLLATPLEVRVREHRRIPPELR